MKFYIAASVKAQENARHLAVKLLFGGDEIVSTWVGIDPAKIGYGMKDDALRLVSYASRDYEEVEQCDVLVQLTEPFSQTGGSHVEFGIALALEKSCVVYGPRVNVFHYHSDVYWAPGLDRLFAVIRLLKKSRLCS